MTPSDAVVFRNVMIPMRDGTKLSTDLYFPSLDGKSPAPGKFPVLMSRTWYNKAVHGIPPLPDFLAANGYVVAIQDVRGRYASPGKDMPWLNDGLGQNQDGYDTAAWLERQSWSTGKLGIFGNSYLGGSAWGTLISQPPSLAVAVVDEPASDNFQNMVYLNGALMLYTAGGWTWGALMGSNALTDAQRASLAKIHEQGADPATMKTVAVASGFGWANSDFFKHLPLRELPLNKDVPWWRMWMDAWEKPWVFDFISTFDRLHEVKAPILHRAGWYSLFLPATLAQYKGASTRPSDPAVREAQRLVVGPWGHGMCPEGSGAVSFPNGATNSIPTVDNDAYSLAMFDRWLKGKSSPLLDSPVLIYVMGENRWRAESSWPLDGTVMTRYFLRSGGNANTAAGDGRLSLEASTTDPADHYEYDPHDPVPSRLSPAAQLGGMCDQSDVEARKDVLVFTTDRLEDDVEVTGEWTVNLYASSSAEDTDWFVKLVDVHPDGKAYNLGQGFVRARYRNSRTEPQRLIPGAIESYTITTWATSNVFKKGHKIRLEVTSSDFPWVDRNPNAFVDLSRVTEADFKVARQTIYHDAAHPSSVDLPVIPASRARQWVDVAPASPPEARSITELSVAALPE